MPDEEHLGGFSHMGFHVISCVDVCWILKVYMDVCLLCIAYSCWWMYVAILPISKWMNECLKHGRYVMYDFMVKMLSYNIICTLFIIIKKSATSHNCASC